MKPTIYLADVLSFLRVAAAPFVIVFSIIGDWRAAFLALAAGWATDLADGAVARKYDSYSATRDIDADGIADSILAFGASIVPVVYAYGHNWIIGALLTGVYAATLCTGIWMVLIMDKPLTPARRWLVAGNMIVMHGLVQIAATLMWFAYMAWGVNAAIGMLYGMLFVIVGQQRKIRLWWAGRFS